MRRFLVRIDSAKGAEDESSPMMTDRRGNRWKIRRYWIEPGPSFDLARVRRIEDVPAPYGVSRSHWWGGAQAGPVPTDLVLIFCSWVLRRLIRIARELVLLPPRVLGLRPWIVRASRSDPTEILVWRVYGRSRKAIVEKVRHAIHCGISSEAPLRTRR